MERWLQLTPSMVTRTIRGPSRITAAKVALTVLGLSCLAAVLVARPSLARNRTEDLVKAAQPVLTAANEWREQNPDGCPTIGVLVRDGLLSSDVDRVDPWGGTLRLVCSRTDNISVLSAGQDGRLGTDDDIEWPAR